MYVISPQVTDDTDDNTFYFTLVPLVIIDSITLYWISLSVAVCSACVCLCVCLCMCMWCVCFCFCVFMHVCSSLIHTIVWFLLDTCVGHVFTAIVKTRHILRLRRDVTNLAFYNYLFCILIFAVIG